MYLNVELCKCLHFMDWEILLQYQQEKIGQVGLESLRKNPCCGGF